MGYMLDKENRDLKKGKCFVIMPFVKQLDGYYTKLIKPAVEALQYEVKRADEIYSVQAIIDDIVNEIESSDFLIADVTGKNPNVNYELGYADALHKDVIIISQSMEDVPFDYKHRRVILYHPMEVNWQEKFLTDLEKTILVVEKKQCGKMGREIAEVV